MGTRLPGWCIRMERNSGSTGGGPWSSWSDSIDGTSHHEAVRRLDGEPMSATDLWRCLPLGKWKQIGDTTWQLGKWKQIGTRELSSPAPALAGYSPLNRELGIYSHEWWKLHGLYSEVTIEAWLASATVGEYRP